jgi:hypothetical protein
MWNGMEMKMGYRMRYKNSRLESLWNMRWDYLEGVYFG